ncbi:MAG: hypothetical protein IPK53_04425 [bacterium]|nr:hypothetical protein [bacterium]
MSRHFRSICILLVILATCRPQPILFAAEISAEVTYVAWRTLYLNAGYVHGVAAGASGLLYHESTLLGELTVAAVAESTCVATISGDSIIARPGDTVVLLLDSQAPVGAPAAPLSDEIRKTETTADRTMRLRNSRRRFTGRASIQTDIYQDKTSTEITPGAALRSTISRVITNDSQFTLKYRGRRRANSEGNEWQHRLYEAGLSLESPRQQWRASIGRIQAGSVAGIGYLDGAYGESGIGKGLAVGAFGGAQAEADLALNDFSATKAGLLITHRGNKSSEYRSQVTVAAAGEYVNGNISREFIYQQCTLGLGSAFSLYESSDFNINRGWRRAAEGSPLSLANMLANVRYSPVQLISISAGYDGRARYHEWETRETPDSLFDDAIRHGLRIGGELVFLHGSRLSAQQSYRSDPTTNSFYPSGSYALSTNALLHGTVGAALRFSTFSNQYSTGEMRSLSATWSPLRNAELRAEYGETQYDYRLTAYRSEADWIRASADFTFRSGTYLSLQSERNSSATAASLRTFIELGHRFR